MKESFNSFKYVADLAQDLVSQFNRAGNGTTPSSVGCARERAIREKLKQLLPGNIDVGSGFVIDSFGYTSKQTDIVIFEKDICPVFSINDAPETTFYPCESVLAVGEVKSAMNTDDIIDAFHKIESVKKCERYVGDTIYWRKYFNTFSTVGAESQRYNQHLHPKDQIFGFVLCQSIGLSITTFNNKCKEESIKRDKHLRPDIIASLQDGLGVFFNSQTNHINPDLYDADTFFFVNNPNMCFPFLLARLQDVMSRGRTTEMLPFNRYVITDDSLVLQGEGVTVI